MKKVRLILFYVGVPMRIGIFSIAWLMSALMGDNTNDAAIKELLYGVKPK